MANEFKVKNGIAFTDGTIQTTAYTGEASGTSFTGPIFGAVTGAPDATIWAVSRDEYPNWGIFYNEGDPDKIEFRANGVANSWISLDTGAANFSGAITQAGNQVLHAGNFNNYAVAGTVTIAVVATIPASPNANTIYFVTG